MEVSEKGEVGEESADGVEQGIPRGGGAAGDEGLVNFVEARVAGGDDESGDAPRPAPADARAADGAEKQNAEDEIFGEVRRLTDEVMNSRDLVMAQVRQEPAEKRFDDAARVILREEVGGHEEDETGPEEGGPPRTEPRRNK